MKTKLVALNLTLLAAIGAVSWQLRIRMLEADKLRLANLHVQVRQVAPQSPSPAVRPEAAPAIRYEDVAKKNLFAKDRNPDVIIDPPKKVEEKKMPPLPIVYGVMGLPSGVKAIMAENRGVPSRGVRTGDSIGEFKILALDIQKVTFEWNGAPLERRIEDLVDRSQPAEGGAPQRENSGPAAPPPSQQRAASGSSASGPSGPPAGIPKEAKANADGTYGYTDNQGKQWVYRMTPFGPMRGPAQLQ